MAGAEVGASGRLQREADFHNQRYRSDPRAGLGPFYEATADSRERFHQVLRLTAPGSDVLELGCGLQDDLEILIDKKCRCVSIDISIEAVDQARRRYADAEVESVVMNAESLELRPNSFDLVFGNGILHHLDVERAIDEIARVLRLRGRAVFVEPLGVNPLINAFRRRTPEMRTPDEHPLKPVDLAAFEASGHFSLQARFFTLSQLAVPLARRYLGVEAPASVCRALRQLDDRLLSGRSPARWLGWMVVIEAVKVGGNTIDLTMHG